ncbi:hypothetical protein [Streptomyces beijiangensis]|uniref:Uncharacterized protein n=1 Tax=Streptomyces beijiangensis TaxID=163361 RepID=A0A939FGG6_9ACTN|nr:hypothetical protein [Streptomyces beijiangensis]MBO0516957.1 hypothetical protein [Streptomyces beijiangensis]
MVHAHDHRSASAQRTAKEPRKSEAPATSRHSALAALQRTAGNAAVTRAVQRYTEGPAAEGFDKLSTNGSIGVRGRYEAYATGALIEEARGRLTATGAPITLERGPTAETAGGVTLYRVLPVYVSAQRIPPGSDPAYEPVAGESEEQRKDKRKQYNDPQRLPALAVRVASLAAKVQAAKADPAALFGEVSRLALDAMGVSVLGDPAFQAMSPTPTLKTVMTFMRQFNGWFSEQLPGMRRQEKDPDELLISLPNDCKAAAAQLLGADPTGLSQVRESPQVGENHYIKFDSSLDTGWNNHFAAVILRDGGDTLTYETAADSNSVVQHGKSLGYFAMYGAHGTDESFASTLKAQNEEYRTRQQP